MPIVKRFASKKATPEKKGNIVRRSFSGVQKRTFADNVEEYVFSLPTTPMPYRDLVLQWIVPYQEGHFMLYGQKLRLMIRYSPLPLDNTQVQITGLLCELVHPTRPKRKIITGSRGIWHGQIKFFVKSTMAEMQT